MNSPNLMAAAAAQRTKKLKLLIYGNLIPLHHPLRLAEELAMIDCLSNGRLIAGIARGIPREYQVHNVPLSESRARFEEAYDIITRAWTEDVFSYQGKFWSYNNVAMWPRPVQQPYPPIWTPITASKESIEFAAKNNIPITPGESRVQGLQQDIIRYYAKCLAKAGHRITPKHLSIAAGAYIADSKAQAVKEAGPYLLYFNRSLFSHGNVTETNLQRGMGYVTDHALDYVSPENLKEARAFARGLSQHDDGGRRQARRDHAVGHRRRSARPHHRGGRPHRRGSRACAHEHRRHAAGNVPQPDPAVRRKGAAGVAGA